MVEFSMNKNSLKELGIFDKQGLEQFYKRGGPADVTPLKAGGHVS
jgi:hypothetical protein